MNPKSPASQLELHEQLMATLRTSLLQTSKRPATPSPTKADPPPTCCGSGSCGEKISLLEHKLRELSSAPDNKKVGRIYEVENGKDSDSLLV